MKKIISMAIALVMLVTLNVTCFATSKEMTAEHNFMVARSGQLYYDSGVSSTGAYFGEFYASQGGDTVFIYSAGATSNLVGFDVYDKYTGEEIISRNITGNQVVHTEHKKLKAGHTYSASMYTAGTFAYVLNFYQN